MLHLLSLIIFNFNLFFYFTFYFDIVTNMNVHITNWIYRENYVFIHKLNYFSFAEQFSVKEALFFVGKTV